MTSRSFSSTAGFAWRFNPRAGLVALGLCVLPVLLATLGAAAVLALDRGAR